MLGSIVKRFAIESYLHEELVVRSRVAVLKGNLDEARELLEKSDKLEEGKKLSVEACLDKAKAFFENGNLSRSDEYMDKLEELADYDDLLANTLTVMVQHQHKQHEHLREEIKTLNNDGLDAYQRGYFGRALEFFQKAFEYMPNNASLALNLLQTLSKIGGVNQDSAKLARRCVQILEQSELNDSNRKRFQAVMKDLQGVMQI